MALHVGSLKYKHHPKRRNFYLTMAIEPFPRNLS